MKKIIFSLFVFAIGLYSFAQTTVVDKAEQEKRDWFHSDFSKTGIYGVGTDSALEFLKSKGMKPTPVVVGVLDSGVQITHEDLKNEIWVNKNEKAGNGKDDDGNGYIDDINGWDFCTTAEGVDYNEDSYEATRMVVLYESYFNSADKNKNAENRRNMPNEYKQYLRARQVWADKYYSAKASVKSGENDNQAQQILAMLAELEAYSKDVKLTKENIENLSASDSDQKAMKDQIRFIVSNNEEFEGLTMGEIIEEAKKEFGEMSNSDDNDLNYAYNLNYNPARGKFDVKGYGNNEVQGLMRFTELMWRASSVQAEETKSAWTVLPADW